MKNKLSLTVALAVGFLSAPAIYAMDHESTDEGHHIRKPTYSIEEFNVGQGDGVEPEMVMKHHVIDPSLLMMIVESGACHPDFIRSIFPVDENGMPLVDENGMPLVDENGTPQLKEIDDDSNNCHLDDMSCLNNQDD